MSAPAFTDAEKDAMELGALNLVAEAARAVLKKCGRPGMIDPFDNSWKWFYDLQDAVRALDRDKYEHPTDGIKDWD